MQILVTGGSGFLGRHVCRQLAAAGHSVSVFDLEPNPEFATTIGDLRDADNAKLKAALKDAEAVVHLAGFIEAGESVENPRKYVLNNILGSFNLIEAMREVGVKKIIFSSSAAVYGEPKQIPIPEEEALAPVNIYGSTKAAVEALLSAYAYNYGFIAICLRYFNLYGPGEPHKPETHAIPRFIHMIEKGMPVTVWGDGQKRRDYVFVEDIARAHILALKLSGFQVINLSTGKTASVMEIIAKISQIMGKKANIKHFPPRPGDPEVLGADAKKAERLLGWKATTSLDNGLKKTVEYFKGKEIVL